MLRITRPTASNSRRDSAQTMVGPTPSGGGPTRRRRMARICPSYRVSQSAPLKPHGAPREAPPWHFPPPPAHVRRAQSPPATSGLGLKLKLRSCLHADLFTLFRVPPIPRLFQSANHPAHFFERILQRLDHL